MALVGPLVFYGLLCFQDRVKAPQAGSVPIQWSALDSAAQQEGGLREYAMRDTEQQGGLRTFNDVPGIVIPPRSM